MTTGRINQVTIMICKTRVVSEALDTHQWKQQHKYPPFNREQTIWAFVRLKQIRSLTMATKMKYTLKE